MLLNEQPLLSCHIDIRLLFSHHSVKVRISPKLSLKMLWLLEELFSCTNLFNQLAILDMNGP